MGDTDYVTKGFLQATLTKALSASEKRMEKRMERMIGQVVGEIVGDALQLISERFDKQDKEITALRDTTNRIENKLDATADKVDDHENRLKKLETASSA